MSLSTIKLANKKAARERRRKAVRSGATVARRVTKVRQKRMRKMMIDGRREHLAQRQAEKNYVAELEAEL